ncbi:hypothetical protein LILPANDA_215 [Klebsiella phage vB_KaeM_LilPanda]|nr:hypothetical protein LILPANDA_215 [Klebsiella phage vB_KaeM_LilPanda]
MKNILIILYMVVQYQYPMFTYNFVNDLLDLIIVSLK